MRPLGKFAMTAALSLVIAMWSTNWTWGQEGGEGDRVSEVETLLAASHGFGWGSGPEIQRLLEEVIASPEQYLPIVEEKMRLPEGPAEWADPEFRLRYERAVLLLAKIGNDEAKRVLRESYFASYRHHTVSTDVEPQSETTGLLLSIQRLILDSLGELGDNS